MKAENALLSRQLTLSRKKPGSDTYPVSLSSTQPVERWFGIEILSHEPDAVDLSRAVDGLPLITSHNGEALPVGRVEDVRLIGDRLVGELRLGNSSQAQEIRADIEAGVIRDVSIGYQILELEKTDTTEDGKDVYTVTRWMPFEASLVSIPADHTVGIGRSQPRETLSLKRSKTMSENQIRKQEAERAADILAICRNYDCMDLAQEYIEQGRSPDELRAEILRRMPESKPLPLDGPMPSELGLSRGELENFSFIRVIRAQLDPRYQKEAGLELEVSRAMAEKLGRDPQGFFIPPEVLKRDLSTGTPGLGGNLVPTQHMGEQFIDMLRARSHVLNLGATIISGVRGNIAIPRQAGGATAYWVAEGSAVTKSDQTFDQVTLTPHTVGARTEYTRRMVLQSSPDVEMIVRQDLVNVLASALDLAAINGSGTNNEPTGILNTAGIGSVAIGPDGGPVDYTHIVDLLAAIASANADTASMAFLTNAQVQAALLKVEKAANTGQFVWEAGTQPGEGRMIGYRALVSNNVPNNLTKGAGTNLSAIIFGNWSDLLVGSWSAIDLLVDPYSLSDSGGVRVVAMQDVDIAVRHPESFAAITDAQA